MQRWLDTFKTKLAPFGGRQALLSLALLCVILFSAAYGIAEVVQGVDTAFLVLVAGLALLVGWFLARSSVTPCKAAAWAVGIGLVILLVRVGRLGGTLQTILVEGGGLAAATARYLWEVLREWVRMRLVEDVLPAVILPPDAGPLLVALSALAEATVTLLSRTGIWLFALLGRAPFYDPAAASMVWGALFWASTVWAVWLLFRLYRPLPAVLPLGFVLAWTLSYTWASPYPLWFLMGAALMLMAVVGHDERVTRWVADKVDFSLDLRMDLISVVGLITIGLMTLSIIAPSVTVENITEIIRKLREPRGGQTVGESLGMEQQPADEGGGVGLARTGGLPRLHLIGLSPELSRRVVMLVKTGELEPMPPDALTVAPPLYYWRGAIYDIYAGRGWYVSHVTSKEYGPGETARTPISPHHRLLRQEVRFLDPPDEDTLIHVAGELVTTDQAYKVAWRTSGDFFAAMLDGGSYRADSLVPAVGADVLREAGRQYPDWIRARYMTLPDTVTERVLALARDLTATELTPYDQAAAIERYLRENYEYTLDVPVPPYDRDLADYFLFDLQKGYCDYFATTMVVLARAAGLPARLVSGYASGTYDTLQAQYIVTEADAHAWPEVYFPGIGWIEFEPTAGRSLLERAELSEPLLWPEPEESLRPPPLKVDAVARTGGLALLGVLAVIALVLLVGAQADLLWLRWQPPVALVTQLYRRFRRRCVGLGIAFNEGDTPYELHHAFTAWLEEASQGRRGREWALQGRAAARVLIDGYVQTWYASVPPDKEGCRVISAAWYRLHWRLYWMWLWAPLENLKRGPLGKLGGLLFHRRRRAFVSESWKRGRAESKLPPLPPRF